MWEALWKERPYQGANFDELVKALNTGKRRPPPSTPRVPSKIRAALERGLSTQREDRFTNMHGLLAALKLPVPRYAIAGGAAMAALAAGGVWIVMRPSPAPSCAHAGDELEALIPRDLPDKLRALGATASAKRVGVDLDRFRANVSEAARTSCEHRKEWSPAIVAKNKACLQMVTRSSAQLMTFSQITQDQVADVEHRVPAWPYLFLLRLHDTDDARGGADASNGFRSSLRRSLPHSGRMVGTSRHHGRQTRPSDERDIGRLESSPMRDWPTVKTRLVLMRAMQANAKGDNAAAARSPDRGVLQRARDRR